MSPTKPRARRWPRLGRLLPIIVVSGCASTLSPANFRDGTPSFEPEVFFRGVTRSSGVVEDRDGAPTRRLGVQGIGRLMPGGELQLVQKVSLGDESVQVRTWLLRRVDDHHLTGTLTDAAGVVEVEAYGDVVHIRYATKSPMFGSMEQWMYLQPDGRTVVNEATVRVLGFVVALLSERITRTDDQ